MKVERYWNEKDEMAVLVSTGWGAGWATWNQPEHAYDKRIIEAFMNGASSDEIEELCKEWGYEPTYTGGWNDCDIVWIPRGTYFYIREHDGYERIVTTEDMTLADDEV